MELEENSRNRRLDVLFEAVSGMERRQATIHTVGKLPEGQHIPRGFSWSDRQLQGLQILLQSNIDMRAEVERQHTAVDKRLGFLQHAIRQAEELVAAYNEANPVASQKSKKSKKNPNAASGMGDAPCGFDIRLVWDDRDFQPWIESPAGEALLVGEETEGTEEEGVTCLQTRRKCDRHAGWQKTKEADFEVQKAGLTRKIDALLDKERQLRRSIEDLQDAQRWQSRQAASREDARSEAGDDMKVTPHVEAFEIPPTPGLAFVSA